MISRDVAEEVLEKALSTGGEFAEIFIDDTVSNSVSMINDCIEKAVSGRDCGTGIRIIYGMSSVYCYTNGHEKVSLIDIAGKAALAVENLKKVQPQDLIERINTNIHPYLYVPSSINVSKKAAIVKKAYKAAKEFNTEIIQVSVGYNDVDRRIFIANSEGLMTQDRMIRSRISVSSVASSGGETQTGTESPGAAKGFEFLEEIDVEAVAREASKTAVTMLHAAYCPAGRMPVAIENGFGGVIFHEACGHSLEASSVAKGNSVFAGKIGTKIASEKVTAVDDGTLCGEWGSFNIDDEGCPARRNVLIENGILKMYMTDRLNGRRMGAFATGNSRRQSYKYQPTSRMTNTYIAAGNDEDTAIISSIQNGLYAKKMGGGSVNPITGEFNFSVAEGYLIKDGFIDRPVRGATLIGKGQEILFNIDMVGRKVKFGQGMCGSSSGSIPVNVGQPLIRVSEITVGGRNK